MTPARPKPRRPKPSRGARVNELQEANESLLGAAISDQGLVEKANESLRMRDQLLAVVAHDLTTLVAAIRFSSEALLTPARVAQLPRHAVRPLQNIRLSAQQLAKLVSDLVDLGKTQGGRLVLDFSEGDLEKMMREAVATVAPLAERRSLRILVKSQGAPRKVICDVHRVMRVFGNLLGNAIKDTPEGGAISFRATWRKRDVRVAVRDSGRGIPLEDVPRVFQAFSQGTGAPVQGMGLGLYLAREIVEAHGGEISVAKTSKAGSTLAFTLPFVPRV